MTIEELIERLKSYPPHTAVMIESKTNGGYATDLDWVINFGNGEPPFAVMITDFPVDPTIERREPNGC